MRRIVRGSLRFRWLVLFLATATLALGFVQIPETKVDVFPEFAPLRIEIQTIALGNSSNEVEQLITVPIEDQLNGIEGLTDLRSKSVAQLSARSADLLPAAPMSSGPGNWLTERLSQITATLPTWASPPFMMPALSATSRIMKIGLTSPTRSVSSTCRRIAYWKIRSRLLRVPGVAQVAIWGERLPQRHVQVDPAKLAEHDVTLQEVMDASADALDAGLLRYSDGAVVGTGGFVETEGTAAQYPPCAADHRSRAARPGAGAGTGRQDRAAGRPGRGHWSTRGPLIGDAVVNDGPGLLLVVQKFRGANTVEVTQGRRAGHGRRWLPDCGAST